MSAGLGQNAASQAERSQGDLLQGWSLEITAKDIDVLGSVAPLLPVGMQISITFLPGEDFGGRVAAASLVRKLGFSPMPHISARRLQSQLELEDFLSRLAGEAQVDRAFVVGGDLATAHGPYDDALAIIQSGVLAKHGVRHVGIAGYPEGHPSIAADRLWTSLEDKVGALRERGQECSIITQFGFDAAPVLSWLCDVRDRGIHVPVRAGVAGPTSVKTLLKFAARCGVASSTKVMAKYGISLTRLFGSAGPDLLTQELTRDLDPAVHGALSLHIYPFGGLMASAKWASSFDAAK